MLSGNITDYDIKIELAKCCNGKFGSVFLAKHLPDSQYYAVKRYCPENGKQNDFQVFCDEVQTARQFNHPNVHTVLYSFVWSNAIYVVSPLMCFGSCKDTLRNGFHTGFPEILVALVIRDILSALTYLHLRGYIHGSVRASHILLNQTKAVLAGFRECKSIIAHGERLKKMNGLTSLSKNSLNWLAPEVLEQNLIGYNDMSDMYSVGITCCELANGIEPFVDAQPTFMYTEKVRGNVPTLLDRTTCPIGEERLEFNLAETAITLQSQEVYSQRSFTEDFHQFSEICMNKNPANRWTAIQLTNHSFFKQCRYTSLSDQLKQFGLNICDYTELRDENLIINGENHSYNTQDDDFVWEF